MKLLFTLFIACLSLISNYAQSEQFTVEKMWSLTRLSNALISPNEKWAFFQTTDYDYTKNKGITTYHLIDLKSKKQQRIPIENAANISWSPSNELMYTQANNNETTIHNWNPLTNVVGNYASLGNVEIDGLVFSPDGKRFATLEAVHMKQTVAEIYPDLPLANARIEDNLMYRHWNQWASPDALHLFWYEQQINGSFVKKGDVMRGEKFPSVTGPFGGIESVCFSKDGSIIYYSTKKKAGKDFALSTNSEIYAFNTKDNITTTLSSAHKGYDTNPAINATGKTLAWLSMETDGFEADKNTLRIMNLMTREEIDLAEKLDLTIDQFAWHPTKDIIYFIAVKNGKKQLFQVAFNHTKNTTNIILELLTNDRCDFVNLVPFSEGVLLERQSMIDPTDLWMYNNKSKSIEQITYLNKDKLAKCAQPTVKESWYTTTDGKKMLAWIVYPPNYDPAKKYPALLYCQGGPQSAVSQYFSYRWNFRLMASEGYIIVAPNRRGLPGFGKEWNDAISKDWGGQAMNDYLTAIDSAVAAEPAIDATKLGAVGASYGGYSVYYLAGIHQNRFKTFVSHCGLFNLESWYGTTEELFFANSDIGGPYWQPENAALYAKNSPHNYVDKWNTPMLVIHGGKDFRVPESEGMQAFQVLQLKGIPSKFLYFPEEGHWVTKPQNGILWYREYFNWLKTYLK